MKVELLQITNDRMLASDNITVKLNGQECDAVVKAELQFDATNHTPRVILTIIPTELKVDLDGNCLLEFGKKGHANYRKNDEVQIYPDDAENADKE